MNALLWIGLLAFGWGIYALSRPTKYLDKSLKYAPVLLAGFGAFHIWQYMASNVPVIAHAQTEVIATQPNKVTLRIQAEDGRPCKMLALEAYVVTEDGVITAADIEEPDFLVENKPRNSKQQIDPVLSVRYGDGNYSSLYFQSSHICSFGILVQSKFGETKIPSESSKTK